MSCPLLELCGRRVIMLEMEVPQVALVRQLVDKVSECFTFLLFLARASPLTPVVPV